MRRAFAGIRDEGELSPAFSGSTDGSMVFLALKVNNPDALATHDSRIWLSHVRASFPGAPSSLAIPAARAVAHNDLKAIRLLRNRIAHHEPTFTRHIADDYRRVREMIAWRSPVAAAWMDRKQDAAGLIPLKP